MSELKELKQEIEQAWEDGDIEKVKELKQQFAEIMPEKPIKKFGKKHYKGFGSFECKNKLA
jgi:uncharacterized membrane protein (DUF106 family)